MTSKQKKKTGRPPIAANVHKLQVRISEDVYQTLVEYSEIQGMKPTAAVRELLNEVEPTLRVTVEAYYKAIEGRADALDGISKGLLNKVIREASKMQGDMFANDEK